MDALWHVCVARLTLHESALPVHGQTTDSWCVLKFCEELDLIHSTGTFFAMPKSAKATPPQQASLKEMWGKKKASTSAKSAKDASKSASSEVKASKPVSGACAHTEDEPCTETSTDEKTAKASGMAIHDLTL